jgi:hypothetical protein
VAEARDLEAELKRLREENIDLRKRVNDFSVVETAKKKAETKVEQLELKVRGTMFPLCFRPFIYWVDGRNDTGEGGSEGERTQCYLR